MGSHNTRKARNKYKQTLKVQVAKQRDASSKPAYQRVVWQTQLAGRKTRSKDRLLVALSYWGFMPVLNFDGFIFLFIMECKVTKTCKQVSKPTQTKLFIYSPCRLSYRLFSVLALFSMLEVCHIVCLTPFS